MAENVSSGQIAAYVFQAISAFERLLSALDAGSVDGAVAGSHFARFKLWVGSLGAHRSSGGRSLEYRLRDASSIKGQIVSLLQDLNESISQGLVFETEATTPMVEENRDQDSIDTELNEYFRDDDDDAAAPAITHTLEDIGHVVDCLLRLSITIRNPAPHDHFRSRTGTNISSLYEEWDIKHAQEKFPMAAAGIVNRLGRAGAQRRQYLKYREDHTNRLAEGLVVPEAATSEFGGSVTEKATTVASSIPKYLKEGEAGAPSVSSNFAQFSDSESIASMTSYAPSNAQSGQLRVPPLPKESNLGPFKCPYCCLILTVDSKREWKKHVFRDLRPYVCTESECTKPDQQYQRRADWLNHMKAEHWKVWNCPFGCLDTFDSPKTFEDHVKEEHPSEKGIERLDTLEGLSRHVDPSKAEGKCPLCDEFQITSEKQFGAHVGAHLEQLALFALPNTDHGDGGDDNTDASNMDVMQERDAESSDCSVKNEDGITKEHYAVASQEILDRAKAVRNPDDQRNDDGVAKKVDNVEVDSGEAQDDMDTLLDMDPLFSDNIYTEFGGELQLERFPEGSIAQGKLLVSHLVDRIIHRFKLPRTPRNVVLFFNDRIYKSSDESLFDIGLASGSRVKVFLVMYSTSEPSMVAITLADRIRTEMNKARKESEKFVKAVALEQGKESLGTLYRQAKHAVTAVLDSLEELDSDGTLLNCWKEEMTHQAQSVRRLIDKGFLDLQDVVFTGNSFKAAAGA